MGLLIGKAVRFVSSSNSLPATVNYGLTIMLVMTFTQFDEALIKIAGSILTTFIAVLILQRVFLYQLLMRVGLCDRRSFAAVAR